jgi:superfamily I DNA/RNA helicase
MSRSSARRSILEPNPEQREAIAATAPRNLIVAGPGRGKTTCIALLAVERGRTGTFHGGQKVLVLTFARQAVFHMSQTLRKADLRDAGGWLEIMTFHGFCFHLLSAFGRYNGLKREIEILSSSMAAARKCEDTQHLLDFSDERTAVFSYDEVLAHAVALLRDSPRLRALYAEMFPVVVVDEVQDTDDAQVELIELLTGNSQLFCFGDPAQHIYGFRQVPADRIDRLAAQWEITPMRWDRESHRSKDPELQALAADILNPRYSLEEVLSIGNRARRFVQTYNHERPAFRVYPIKSWLLKHAMGGRYSNCGAILAHGRRHLESIAAALGRAQENLSARFNCQLLYEDSQSDMVEFLAHAWNWHHARNVGSLRRVIAFINADQTATKRKAKAGLEALVHACTSDSALADLLAPWPKELMPLLSRGLTKEKDSGNWAKVSRKLGPLLEKALHRTPNLQAVKPAREEVASMFGGAVTDADGAVIEVRNSPAGLIETVRKQRLLESVLQKSAPLRGLTGLTMHASKGKEFDHVLIVPETYTLSSSHFDQPDNRKMWHVAVTRTRGAVGFVLPSNWSVIARRPRTPGITV